MGKTGVAKASDDLEIARLESLHMELFGGYERAPHMAAKESSGVSFDIFTMYKPIKTTYSARTVM